MKQSTGKISAAAASTNKLEGKTSKGGSKVKSTKYALEQDVGPEDGILPRVKAFVNLKFTPTVEELAFVKDPVDVKRIEQV
jgi:hypothetical protein